MLIAAFPVVRSKPMVWEWYGQLAAHPLPPINNRLSGGLVLQPLKAPAAFRR